MRIIDLAVKDLGQLARDWKSATFLLIMPIAITVLFSIVFGGGGSGEEDPRLPVGVLDQDGGAVGSHLLALLEASKAVRPVVLAEVDVEGAKQQVGDGDLAAAVILPPGYSDQVLSLTGEAKARPLLVADVNSPAGHTAQIAVQAGLVRLLGAVETARLTGRAFEAQGGTASPAFLEGTLARAMEAWADPPLGVRVGQSGLIPAGEEESLPAGNNFGHSSAGIMVQFAMAGLIGAAEIMVLERKSGALRRLLTTPISRLEIVLGHFLAMLVMILAQLVVLVVFGQIALGVDYLRVPLGSLLMIAITAFWSASLGLLLGILARTEDQVIIFSLVTMLLLAGLGGAWMPLEFTSQTFQRVGHLMPTAWAIDGFENLVVRGLGLDSVLKPAAILLAYAVVFFAVGVWRFRFE